jgi:hypothetical protein
MSDRTKRWIAWLGAGLLLGLHHDFFRPQEARLVFGWVPEDLAYRLVWMAAATLYLFWFTARVWETREDE